MEPGLDRDNRITLLMHDVGMNESGQDYGGYFSPTDQFAQPYRIATVVKCSIWTFTSSENGIDILFIVALHTNSRISSIVSERRNHRSAVVRGRHGEFR